MLSPQQDMPSELEIKPTTVTEVDLKHCWTAGNSCGFPPRVNHVLVTDGASLYSLGGSDKDVPNRYTDNRPHQYRQNQDDLEVNETLAVHTLEKGALAWKVPRTFGPMIHGRYGHSCCYYNRKLYLYGGKNGSTFFGDVNCFDIESHSWMTLECLVEDCAYPYARFGHACAVSGPVMYIQGGRVDHHHQDTAELLSFNMETRIWRVETTNFLGLYRKFHSAIYVDGKIIVFGGIDSSHEFENESLSASYVVSWDQSPLLKRRRRDYAYDSGFYEYNISHEQRKLSLTGYQPAGRRTVTAICFDSSIIYYGGYANGKFFDDTFFLNTKTNLITLIKPFGEGPPPLRGASACLLGSQVILSGGVQPIVSRCHTSSQVYALHCNLVPSLENMCLLVVAKENLSTTLLPQKIQTKVSLL